MENLSQRLMQAVLIIAMFALVGNIIYEFVYKTPNSDNLVIVQCMPSTVSPLPMGLVDHNLLAETIDDYTPLSASQLESRIDSLQKKLKYNYLLIEALKTYADKTENKAVKKALISTRDSIILQGLHTRAELETYWFELKLAKRVERKF